MVFLNKLTDELPDMSNTVEIYTEENERALYDVSPQDQKSGYSRWEKVEYNLPAICDALCASVITWSSWQVLWKLMLLAVPGQPNCFGHILTCGALDFVTTGGYRTLNNVAEELSSKVVQRKYMKSRRKDR
jgi:hypothetical protein